MYSYENALKHHLGSIGFISDIIYYDSIDSTNNFAKRLVRSGVEEWTVVIADSQSVGRGRRERRWHSPPGVNIYTSFVLKPIIPYGHFPAISLLAGMVVAEVAEQFINVHTELKWPNDVMIKGKKISGILLELENSSDNCPYVIVGIGINVNSDVTAYPDGLAGSSISMMLPGNKIFDRVEILSCLYRKFYKWYNVYCDNNGFNSIKEPFMRRFGMMNKSVYTVNGTQRINGIVKDIDEYGGLVLTDGRGETIVVKSGDIHSVQIGV